MKYYISFISLLFTLIVFAACSSAELEIGDDNPRGEIILSDSEQSIVNRCNDMAFSTIAQLLNQTDANLVFSPLNLAYNCALLSESTSTDLMAAAGMNGVQAKDVSNFCKVFFPALNDCDKTVNFSLSDGLGSELCFDGRFNSFYGWLHENRPFFASDGASDASDYLNRGDSGFAFYSNDKLTWFSTGYGNNSFGMTFIMPQDGDVLSLASEMTNETILSIKSAEAIPSKGKILIPVFSIESSCHFPHIESAVNGSYSSEAISGVTAAELNSSILQRARIDVTDGKKYESKESASPGMRGNYEMSWARKVLNAETVDITFDHPFIFIISETSTGAILFMGAKVK